jgi:hypothetical protein
MQQGKHTIKRGQFPEEQIIVMLKAVEAGIR